MGAFFPPGFVLYNATAVVTLRVDGMPDDGSSLLIIMCRYDKTQSRFVSFDGTNAQWTIAIIRAANFNTMPLYFAVFPVFIR